MKSYRYRKEWDIVVSQNKTVKIKSLMASSGVQFGTSGARGLVTAMTDEVCYAYTCGFLQYLKNTENGFKQGGDVAISADLRTSSPRILIAVAAAIRDQGGRVVHCGFIPSPALAYFGQQRHIPSMMITGSHIPDDRNGIKFNTPCGEITKSDEAGIRAQCVKLPCDLFDSKGHFLDPNANDALPPPSTAAYALYVARYLNFFPKNCLHNKTVALYEHSSVGRDIFYDILTQLGAKVIRLARSETFISVDTEAIRPEDARLAKAWAQEHRVSCIISADGDADRPLTSDETGEWIRGDVTGILVAEYLQAKHVVTPISSNSAIEKYGRFKTVVRTRIGSPYVIEAMQQQANHGEITVGYEANGGFLIQTPVEHEGRMLNALPTRDAIIVPLALLMLADSKNLSLSQLVATLPPRYTASNRVKNFPTEQSQAILAKFQADAGTIDKFFAQHFGAVKHLDTTDGLRITFHNDEVVHLRPSGNAPEFRCYNEASSAERALAINELCMDLIAHWRT